MFRVLITLVFSLSLSACETFRFPGVHRISIQQGNVVTQQMIDKLRPGMTKSQVRFVLGNAVIEDSLNADRWDYVYTLEVPDTVEVRKTLSLYFIDDRLSYFTGDYVPTEEYQALSQGQ